MLLIKKNRHEIWHWHYLCWWLSQSLRIFIHDAICAVAHNAMKHVVESNEALVRQTWQYLAKCVGMKEVLPLVGMTQRRNFAPKDSCIYFKPSIVPWLSPNGTENGIKQKNNGKVTQEYEKLWIVYTMYILEHAWLKANYKFSISIRKLI